jgi:hypothetical protein
MSYCSECKQECEVKWEDVGIGGYEYAGAPGVDIQWSASSVCCGAEVFDDPECTVPFSGDPIDDCWDDDVDDDLYDGED